jgi:pyridoxal phosphate enzyme (YggS family)
MNRQEELQANLEKVRKELVEAEQQAGRKPGSVVLVAVSKTRPASDIALAFSCKQLDFGENYAQELRDKAQELAETPVRWHFIGSLQRNKVKYVVGRAMLVHDVDNMALAEEISRRSGATKTSILLGVNIGREPQKSGWMPDQLLEVAPRVAALPGISLEGLMCIPPEGQNPALFFQEMAELAQEGCRQGLPLKQLSMGMSQDFKVAVQYGATLIRVGTAIFGARNYTKT